MKHCTGIAVRKSYLLIAVAAALLAGLACALPGGGATPTAVPPATSAPQPTAATATTAPATATYTRAASSGSVLDSGAEIGVVTASGNGFTGTGNLTVPVTNPTDQPITFILPAGFVFLPSDSGLQRLMVVKTLTVTIQPGETVTLDPFIVCIDSGNHAPDSDAGYSPGDLVDNEQLLQFAECLDGQDLSGSDDMFSGMGVQFAVWSVADGTSPSDIQSLLGNATETPSGAMGQAMSSEFGQMMQPFITAMTQGAAQYLQTCGIDTSTPTP